MVGCRSCESRRDGEGPFNIRRCSFFGFSRRETLTRIHFYTSHAAVEASQSEAVYLSGIILRVQASVSSWACNTSSFNDAPLRGNANVFERARRRV